MMIISSYYPMNGIAIHGRKEFPWMAGAIGSKIQRQDVWNDTVGVPSIQENPFYPWMADIHEWNATYRRYVVPPIPSVDDITVHG